MLTIGWSIAYYAALTTWVIGGLMQQFGRRESRLAQLKCELHPFLPFLMLINLAIVTWGHPIGPNAFQYAMAAAGIAGWFMGHDDDDRWKRRRRKLAGKVARLGARLVVTS